MSNGDLIWERKRDGGFPEAKVLKQKVRDIVWPERDLGHSDGHKKAEGASSTAQDEEGGELRNEGAGAQRQPPSW